MPDKPFRAAGVTGAPSPRSIAATLRREACVRGGLHPLRGRARKIPIIRQTVKNASRSRFGRCKCIKSLLFAPRLMLERRPQVHRAVRAPPNGAHHPFHEPLCPPRADEFRTARLIAKG